eukprot:gene12381-8507_t
MLSDTTTRLGRSAVLGFHASDQTNLQRLCPTLRKTGRCPRYNKEMQLRREIARKMESKIKKKATELYELQKELLEEEEEVVEDDISQKENKKQRSKAYIIGKLVEEVKQEPAYRNWSLDADVAEAMVNAGVRSCHFAHNGVVEVHQALQQRQKRILQKNRHQQELLPRNTEAPATLPQDQDRRPQHPHGKTIRKDEEAAGTPFASGAYGRGEGEDDGSSVDAEGRSSLGRSSISSMDIRRRHSFSSEEEEEEEEEDKEHEEEIDAHLNTLHTTRTASGTSSIESADALTSSSLTRHTVHPGDLSSIRSSPAAGINALPLQRQTPRPTTATIERWKQVAVRARRTWDQRRHHLFSKLSPVQRFTVCLLWQRRCVVPFSVVCDNVRDAVCQHIEAEFYRSSTTEQVEKASKDRRRSSHKRKEEGGEAMAEACEAAVQAYMESAAFEPAVDAAGAALVPHWTAAPQPLGQYDLSFYPRLVCHYSHHPTGIAPWRSGGAAAKTKECSPAAGGDQPLLLPRLENDHGGLVLPLTRYYMEGLAAPLPAAPPPPSSAVAGNDRSLVGTTSRRGRQPPLFPPLLQRKMSEKEVDVSMAAQAEALVQAMEFLLFVLDEERTCHNVEEHYRRAIAAARTGNDDEGRTPCRKRAREEEVGDEDVVHPFPLLHAAALWGGGSSTANTTAAGKSHSNNSEMVDDECYRSRLHSLQRQLFDALRLGHPISEGFYRSVLHATHVIAAMEDDKTTTTTTTPAMVAAALAITAAHTPSSSTLRATTTATTTSSSGGGGGGGTVVQLFPFHALSLRFAQLTSAESLLASLKKRPRLVSALFSLDLSHNRLRSLRFLFQLRRHQLGSESSSRREKEEEEKRSEAVTAVGPRSGAAAAADVTIPLVRLSLAANAITTKPDYQEQVRCCLPQLMALDGAPIRRPPLRLPNPVTASITSFIPPSACLDDAAAVSLEEHRCVLDFLERFVYMWETGYVPRTAAEEKDQQQQQHRSPHLPAGVGEGNNKKKKKEVVEAAAVADLADRLEREEQPLTEENYPHRYHHPDAMFSFSLDPALAPSFFDKHRMKLEREVEMEAAVEEEAGQHHAQQKQPNGSASGPLQLSAQDYREAQLFAVAMKNTDRNLLQGRRALSQVARGAANVYLAYRSTVYPERLEVRHHLPGALIAIHKLSAPSGGGDRLYLVQLHGIMTWTLPSMTKQLGKALAGSGTAFFTAAYDRTLTLVPRKLPRQNRHWESRKGHTLVLRNDQLHLRLAEKPTSQPALLGSIMASDRTTMTPRRSTAGADAPPCGLYRASALPTRELLGILAWGLEGCSAHDGATLVRCVLELANSESAFHAALDVLVFCLVEAGTSGDEEAPHRGQRKAASAEGWVDVALLPLQDCPLGGITAGVEKEMDPTVEMNARRQVYEEVDAQLQQRRRSARRHEQSPKTPCLTIFSTLTPPSVASRHSRAAPLLPPDVAARSILTPFPPGSSSASASATTAATATGTAASATSSSNNTFFPYGATPPHPVPLDVLHFTVQAANRYCTLSPCRSSAAAADAETFNNVNSNTRSILDPQQERERGYRGSTEPSFLVILLASLPAGTTAVRLLSFFIHLNRERQRQFYSHQFFLCVITNMKKETGSITVRIDVAVPFVVPHTLLARCPTAVGGGGGPLLPVSPLSSLYLKQK